MPFQVNGQAVTTKSSRLVHVAGCDRPFAVVVGAAFVGMMSSAADTCEHVASRRKEPVIAVRQAVQAIVPPYRLLFKYYLPELLSDPCRPLLDASASDVSHRNASRLAISQIGTIDRFVC
jgi:hypothetical protein